MILIQLFDNPIKQRVLAGQQSFHHRKFVADFLVCHYFGSVIFNYPI
jgi:hypothetical protein